MKSFLQRTVGTHYNNNYALANVLESWRQLRSTEIVSENDGNNRLFKNKNLKFLFQLPAPSLNKRQTTNCATIATRAQHMNRQVLVFLICMIFIRQIFSIRWNVSKSPPRFRIFLQAIISCRPNHCFTPSSYSFSFCSWLNFTVMRQYFRSGVSNWKSKNP